MQQFITRYRVHHQHLALNGWIKELRFKLLVSVLKEVLGHSHLLLKLFGFRFHPIFPIRGFSSVPQQRMKTVVRCDSKRVNRDRIALLKPEPDRAFKLRRGYRLLCNKDLFNTAFRHRLQFWGAHRSLCVLFMKSALSKITNTFMTETPHDNRTLTGKSLLM